MSGEWSQGALEDQGVSGVRAKRSESLMLAALSPLCMIQLQLGLVSLLLNAESLRAVAFVYLKVLIQFARSVYSPMELNNRVGVSAPPLSESERSKKFSP